jgi:hypothetical protein
MCRLVDQRQNPLVLVCFDKSWHSKTEKVAPVTGVGLGRWRWVVELDTGDVGGASRRSGGPVFRSVEDASTHEVNQCEV